MKTTRVTVRGLVCLIMARTVKYVSIKTLVTNLPWSLHLMFLSSKLRLDAELGKVCHTDNSSIRSTYSNIIPERSLYK